MKNLLVICTICLVGLSAFCQTQTPKSNDAMPVVLRFVAPPYPQAAKDKRIMGVTLSELDVATDGSVKNVRIVHAHPVFASHVGDALRRWRFKPTAQEFTLAVTVSFEINEDLACTDETMVSADLPDKLRIVIGPHCVNVEMN